MVVLPHKHDVHIQVPLKRGFESFDDVPACVQKAFELLAVLWEEHEHSPEIEKLFMRQKLISYSTKKGEKLYSAPFLHHFYILTNEGLMWLQNKYLTKHHVNIELVGSLSELKAIQEGFLHASGPTFIPIIFYDPSFSDCHVSACAFLKNSSGKHFFYLDSVGRETYVFRHTMMKDLLDPTVEYYINVERRQIDGFNCRTEAFILLKSLFKFFEKKPEMTPHDLFARIDPSVRLDSENHVYLRGCFLKTAQFFITDARKNDQVISKDISLAMLQDLFGIQYMAHHESVKAGSVEMTGSCVYLQCKTLKYVLQYIEETKAAFAKANKEYVFSTTEDF